MQIVQLNNFIHNSHHFPPLFAHSEKLWAGMLSSPEPSASRPAISAAVTRSLAACAGDGLSPLIVPWAPAPLPPVFPPSPPPPAAAFTPGGGVSRGSGPGPRVPEPTCPVPVPTWGHYKPGSDTWHSGHGDTSSCETIRTRISLAPSEITPHTKWPGHAAHPQTFHPFTAGCKVFLTKVTKLSPGRG